MNVLVTGASGFLGSHVVDACLRRGFAVRALARPTSDLSYLRSLPAVDIAFGDLDDAASLARATRGVDAVIHSAARVSDFGSREDFYRANVDGTDRLLDAARANGVPRFVFVSSPSVVAEDRDQVGIDESYPYPTRHLHLYCETKAIAEQRVLAANGDGIATTAVRPRGVWGPRDRTGPLPKIVAKMMTGRLPDLSGGRRVFASLCYCENAADACVLAATSERAPGMAYFVTDAEPVDVWAFASRVAARFGAPPITRRLDPRPLRVAARVVDAIWKLPPLGHKRPPPISRYSLALLTRSTTYDIRAAERDLGYVPRVEFETAFERFVRWVEASGGVAAFTRYVTGAAA